MNQNQQRAAINALKQISNQDTVYEWTLKTKYKNMSNMSNIKKKRKVTQTSVKQVKLPLLMKQKNVQELKKKYLNDLKEFDKKHEDMVHIKSSSWQKPKSLRVFFQQSSPNLVYKENCKTIEQQNQKRESELEIIKSWLTRKKMECKSLQILINKFKDDSGKHEDKNKIFPFKIKTLA